MLWRRSRSLASRPAPRFAAGLAALALAGACAEVATQPPPPRLVTAESAFLLPPASGYPGRVQSGLAASLDDLHRRLLVEGAGSELLGVVATLARERPDSAPIQVLLAQLEFVGGDADGAGRRLGPVLEQWPSYDAAVLLLGRVLERLGELPRAFDAYRSAADRIPTAAERVGEMRQRVLEIVSNRLDEAIATGDLERAAEQVARLESWAPSATATLRGARRLAAARGDARAELATVRELGRRLPEDAEIRDRLAELEVAVGDPGAGISILQEMAAERPGDLELAARLSRARFRWRLVLLPAEVRTVTRAPELQRAELAALLYWLFPSVRYARPQSARIANDVFDHPFREEIVRVINLDLMEIDPGLHHFAPAAAATRAESLAAVLRVVAAARPDEACLDALTSLQDGSWPIACAAAAACGLIETEADCLPAATLSGGEAVDLCRRAQLLLGGE
jgi:tetratricopeptide (TPR) repeat protein